MVTPTLALDVEALAAHRVQHGRTAKGLRPVNYRLDSEGLSLAVSLPGPEWLATMLSVEDGVQCFRSGGALVARVAGSDAEPEPVSLHVLAGALRGVLGALPERTDAEDAYRETRLAAGIPSPLFGAYALDVVRALVRSLPAYRAVTVPKAARPPAKSATERKRAERSRRRFDEFRSANWAIAVLLADEEERTLEPASRLSGSALAALVEDLLGYAVERYADAVSEGEEWDEVRADEWEIEPPARPRFVSARVLFKVVEGRDGLSVTRPKGSVAVRCSNDRLSLVSEPTAIAVAHAGHVLDRTPEDPETLTDSATASVRRHAPASLSVEFAGCVEALPVLVSYAVAAAEPDEVASAFGLAAREHLRRWPEDGRAIGAVAVALRDGDPGDVVGQIRAHWVARLDAEAASA